MHVRCWRLPRRSVDSRTVTPEAAQTSHGPSALGKTAGIWAVVPIKALDRAKSRLAPILGTAARRALVLTMLQHTLSVLVGCGDIEQTIVISPDPAVRDMARAQGAGFLLEMGVGGLNDALSQAGQYLLSRDAKGMLVVPGDLPYLCPSSIHDFVALGAHSSVVIAPNQGEDGTNGLLVLPADRIPFCFGPGSFRRHCAAATRAGATPLVYRSSDFAIDVDLPEDLEITGFARESFLDSPEPLMS